MNAVQKSLFAISRKSAHFARQCFQVFFAVAVLLILLLILAAILL